jgi:hypothetical protein
MYGPCCLRGPGATLKGVHLATNLWLIWPHSERWASPTPQEFDPVDTVGSWTDEKTELDWDDHCVLWMSSSEVINGRGSKVDLHPEGETTVPTCYSPTLLLLLCLLESILDVRKNWPLGLNFSEAMKRKCTMKLYGSCERRRHLLFL